MPTPDEALLFYLPAAFDLGAVFFFALTGALVAIRRGYDLLGLLAMSFISGLGGGLIRDGLFLQDGPPALTAIVISLPMRANALDILSERANMTCLRVSKMRPMALPDRVVEHARAGVGAAAEYQRPPRHT